jgi:methionine synthase II (cobalamin-independent)
LVKKINDGIDVLVKKGVERGKLSENLLLSPSCGLGTLDIEKSEKIFQLLSGVSFLLRKTQK